MPSAMGGCLCGAPVFIRHGGQVHDADTVWVDPPPEVGAVARPHTTRSTVLVIDTRVRAYARQRDHAYFFLIFFLGLALPGGTGGMSPVPSMSGGGFIPGFMTGFFLATITCRPSWASALASCGQGSQPYACPWACRGSGAYRPCVPSFAMLRYTVAAATHSTSSMTPSRLLHGVQSSPLMHCPHVRLRSGQQAWS